MSDRYTIHVKFYLTDEQTQRLDTALDTIESVIEEAGMTSLSPDTRKNAARMGDKGESFCRKTLEAMQIHRQVLTPLLNDGIKKNHMATFDKLRPRLMRLTTMTERLSDSVTALRIDIMNLSLGGYNQFGASGFSETIRQVYKNLSVFFKRMKRKTTDETPPEKKEEASTASNNSTTESSNKTPETANAKEPTEQAPTNKAPETTNKAATK